MTSHCAAFTAAKKSSIPSCCKKVRDPLKKVDHRQLPQHFISMFFSGLAAASVWFGLAKIRNCAKA